VLFSHEPYDFLVKGSCRAMIIKGFKKYHMSLVVLVKKMSVLINFLTQNTNLVSVLTKICPNLGGVTIQCNRLSHHRTYEL
jgi:hypothetical protein